MREFTIQPTVNTAQEFVEIANDFANPLDLLREAVSNAFDAQASDIAVLFSTEKEHGEAVLVIELSDNGDGMDEQALQSFFDLGNSTRRADASKIGEKGHGTKIYFNSKRVDVWTSTGKVAFHATMVDPARLLQDHVVPQVTVSEKSADEIARGTRIVIRGYNNNRRDRFTHEILKDHAMWFSKFGSIELGLERTPVSSPLLRLKGLDRPTPESLKFGHYFPPQSVEMKRLFDEHLVAAPDHFCKRVVREGSLKNFPEISYQVVFSVEGKHVKYGYNSMLRRQGYQAPVGAYRVQDRYGVWVCKDFIPVQRKNDWITTRGSEYTRLHAFVNCQDLRLTANRGSIENTPAEILDDLRAAVNAHYEQIIESDDWRELEWLEEEATGYRTTEKEKKDFDWRKKKVSNANVAVLDHVTLVEPLRESGVYSLFIQVSTLRPGAFPFCVVEYDTHSGIDVIAKGDATTPIYSARLFYVEFKHRLQKQFNHSFEHLHSVVCWDTDIKQDDIVIDINDEQRKMEIAQKEDGDYTRYFLTHPKRAHRIEVFVLKDYLREKLSLDFRPRAPGAAT
ncbi:MAG TPA: ATP-binding protein [Polyangiaceae bacterium]|nr:ATP-binding protein [Polyangiaceae bacterium]